MTWMPCFLYSFSKINSDAQYFSASPVHMHLASHKGALTRALSMSPLILSIIYSQIWDYFMGLTASIVADIT